MLTMSPADAMIVVSEIGEQWSPHTAPARQDAIEITIICPDGNTPITIGIRILKVPHDVPVANASKAATMNMIIGRKPCMEPAELIPDQLHIPLRRGDSSYRKVSTPL